jgi:hypothetical protein
MMMKVVDANEKEESDEDGVSFSFCCILQMMVRLMKRKIPKFVS